MAGSGRVFAEVDVNVDIEVGRRSPPRVVEVQPAPIVERVWVPDRVIQKTETVMATPPRVEKHFETVCVAPAHVERQELRVLVAPARIESIREKVLVHPAHFE